MLRIRAGSVCPVTAPPIQDGAVLVSPDGRIAAVGPDAVVPAPPDVRRLDFPEAVLVPGLVNTHTHLELSHLAGQNGEADFVRWIRRVRELKEATARDDFLAAAEEGIRDCWRRGVTCVAETGSTGAVLETLHRLGGRGIVYQEVFGPDPARLEASLDDLVQMVDRLRPFTGWQTWLGASPHAPYTVSAELYRAVASYAVRDGLPLAVHLAESPAESAYVRDGTGPFADALRARGIPVEARGVSPVQFLRSLGVLRRGTLAIHCVQLDATDVAALAETGTTVSHCPRSNRAHGHGAAPVAALRRAGVPVGVGTDSLVSVPDLNLWAEVAAAGLEGPDALRALTIDGARVLWWDRIIGSLEPGKAADLAVFQAVPPESPAALLTLVAGRIVHQAR